VTDNKWSSVRQICSTRVKKCSTNWSKLRSSNTNGSKVGFEHEWFKGWLGSNFEDFVSDRSHLDPFVDQQLIQVSHQFDDSLIIGQCIP